MARRGDGSGARPATIVAALGERLARADAAARKAIGPDDEPAGPAAWDDRPAPSALLWLAAALLGALGAGVQLVSAYYAPVFTSRFRNEDLPDIARLLALAVTSLCGGWFGGLVHGWAGRGRSGTVTLGSGLAVLVASTIASGLIDVAADGSQAEDAAAF